MTPNNHSANTTTSTPISAALLDVEKSGQFPIEAWPALRELLLASADPQLAAIAEPLRQFVQVHGALATAKQELEQGYTAVVAAFDHPAQLAEAAASLSLLADELAARAQRLVMLEG